MTRGRTVPRSAGFLFGVSLSLLPAVGPLAAALLVVAQSWRIRTRDLPWLVASLLFGLTDAVNSGLQAGLIGGATVLGPWLVFRTFADLERARAFAEQQRSLATGLLAGFVAIIVVGLFQTIGGLDLGQSSSLLGSIAWQSSPAVFGHGMVVIGGIIALVTWRVGRIRWVVLALSFFGILLSGSIEAAFGWSLLVVALSLSLADGRRRPSAQLVRAVAAVAVAWSLIVLAPFVGWGRIGFLVTSGAASPAGSNLLAGTELPGGDWWLDAWVDVTTSTVDLGPETGSVVAYEVTKRGPEDWLRLQQAVSLVPGATYTLSAWIEAPSTRDAVPGLQGWGQAASSDGTLVLIGDLVDDRWRTRLAGPGELLASGVAARHDAWTRVYASFAVDQDASPITWFAGFVPDARTSRGETARVAGLMLERGDALSPYRPGGASFGLGPRYARVPLWEAAWTGFLARPWFGWGDGTFADHYQATRPGIERLELVPHHAHNLFLGVLFERGLVGLLGLLLVIGVLIAPAIRTGDRAMLGLFGAVLVLNLFDATLFHGAIIYPLAAVAGWRSLLGEPVARTSTHARPVLVRSVLAAADLAVVALAMAVALQAGRGAEALPLAQLGYGLMLWPALAWREGLYPGYGLTAAQELKRQVAAWSQASLALLVLAALTPLGPGLTPLGYGVFFSLSLVALPIARASLKRGLVAIGVWGRPVVVLGAGATGRRVIASLERTPLDGLHPVAVFDDDTALHGRTIGATTVTGSLSEAKSYARRHGVQHAIVAISRLDPGRRTRVLAGDDLPFRTVHYVPRLDSLPSYDVVAREIDGLLALEAKIGLASAVNRSIKRTFDVVAVILGGLLASPVLLGLAVAVRVDSAGPVFYGQKRIGRRGRHFTAWKFRSMRPDADAVLAAYLDEHPELRAEWEATQKLQDDPRVTRFGRFLRGTSLDELPQIWNVLRGEMSLVGPRPIVDAEVSKYGDVFELYTLVRPGISGLWQVSGRSDTTYDERVAMDAHYVRNWSVWLDLVILANTLGAVLRRDGAY